MLPSLILAADEDIAAEKSSEEIQTETVNEDNRMLRQTHTIIGYQPLTVAGQEIDATYIEETLGERHGAVVLLHDAGEQFESQGVVTPLRHNLPEYGWSTLTLAFDYPFEAKILLSGTLDADVSGAESAVEENESFDKTDGSSQKEDETNSKALPPISNQQRIEAALSFLQAKEVRRIIFIGHGAGGDMAIELLDGIKTPVSALILVGATALPENDIFKEFNFPVFDIYGSNDLEVVPAAVKYRKTLMKRINNTRYEVRRVMGADHIFLGLEPTLVVTITAWLRKKFIEKNDH